MRGGRAAADLRPSAPFESLAAAPHGSIARDFMLSYTARAFAVGVRASRRPPIGPYDVVHQRHRAWPHVCDQNGHINNAQFLTFMDWGRIEWLVRTGLWSTLGKDRVALVAGLGMTYLKEIRMFAAFDLRTQVVGSDARWMYVSQEFRLAADTPLAARGIVRVCVRGPSGIIAPADLFGVESPALPDDVAAWRDGEDAALRILRGAPQNLSPAKNDGHR